MTVEQVCGKYNIAPEQICFYVDKGILRTPKFGGGDGSELDDDWMRRLGDILYVAKIGLTDDETAEYFRGNVNRKLALLCSLRERKLHQIHSEEKTIFEIDKLAFALKNK